jgi:hypothetical protein
MSPAFRARLGEGQVAELEATGAYLSGGRFFVWGAQPEAGQSAQLAAWWSSVVSGGTAAGGGSGGGGGGGGSGGSARIAATPAVPRPPSQDPTADVLAAIKRRQGGGGGVGPGGHEATAVVPRAGAAAVDATSVGASAAAPSPAEAALFGGDDDEQHNVTTQRGAVAIAAAAAMPPPGGRAEQLTSGYRVGTPGGGGGGGAAWVTDQQRLWVDDGRSTSCMLCDGPFRQLAGKVVVGRHHCRCCGLIICDKCTAPERRALPAEFGYGAAPQRVCGGCVERLGRGELLSPDAVFEWRRRLSLRAVSDASAVRQAEEVLKVREHGGVQELNWQCNSAECRVCHRPFKTTRRTHHCRRCGASVCDTCRYLQVLSRSSTCSRLTPYSLPPHFSS